jgi:hypothetical protein
MRWVGHVAGIWKSVNVYAKYLLRNLREKRLRGRFRLIREDNIKMDLLEIVREGVVDWSQLDQDKDQWRFLVNTVMNIRVP